MGDQVKLDSVSLSKLRPVQRVLPAEQAQPEKQNFSALGPSNSMAMKSLRQGMAFNPLEYQGQRYSLCLSALKHTGLFPSKCV